MSSKWYFVRDGKKEGPVSIEILKAMAMAQAVKPSDTVFQEGSSQWVAAGSVSGLFTTVVATVAPSPALAPAPLAEVTPTTTEQNAISPMPAQWFIARQRQKHGPYPFEQLHQWARTGVLLPTELVLGDSGKWQAAGSVAGLFDFPVAAVAEPLTPGSQTISPQSACSTNPLAAILADPKKRVLCIAGATGALCLILLCGGVFALVRSLAKPTDQVAQVAVTTQNKQSSKMIPETLPTRPANDTSRESPKDDPKDVSKDEPRDLPKDSPKDLPMIAPPQQQQGNEAAVQEFIKAEKARLDRLHGFDKVDYTKGPRGEALDQYNYKGVSYQGYKNADQRYVDHGHIASLDKTKDGKPLSEGMAYNGVPHGVHIWWHVNGMLDRLFVMKHGRTEGRYLLWDANGNLRHEQIFKNSMLHGVSTWYVPGEAKATFEFESGKPMFSRKGKTKAEFMTLLKYTASSYSDPAPGAFVGRFPADRFFEWVGEPDRKVGNGPRELWSGRFWYICSDGTVSFKAHTAPTNLIVLEDDQGRSGFDRRPDPKVEGNPQNGKVPPLSELQSPTIAPNLDAVVKLLGPPTERWATALDPKASIVVWNKGDSGWIAIYFLDGFPPVRGAILGYKVDRNEIDRLKKKWAKY